MESTKESALRIVRFERTERVLSELPRHLLHYLGCNHQGFENPKGHDVPLGTRWGSTPLLPPELPIGSGGAE